MINILCHFFGNQGVHRLGRGFVKALGSYDEIALLPIEYAGWFRRSPRPVRTLLRNARGRLDNNIGLALGSTDLAPRIPGQPKALHTVWETTKIPASRREHLSLVDEIWTPSSWGRRVLVDNCVPEHKVHVVPEGVDPGEFQPADDSGPTPRPFRFLCVGKWEARKGGEMLVRAFVEAFRPHEPVELVLHCHNPEVADFSIHSALAKLRLPPHAPICVSHPLEETRMAQLYNSCDAFVLPTKGEGWGLPIIEAMACSKPVIVTGHGAVLDYVTPENGYLLRVEKLVDVDDPLAFDPALDFGQWALPDAEHLQQLLRHVFENQDEAREKGRLARKHVVASWTWDHAAAKAWRRVKVLRGD